MGRLCKAAIRRSEPGGLVQIEVQNGKKARAKVDLFMPKDCPGFTGIAVRELAEMLECTPKVRQGKSRTVSPLLCRITNVGATRMLQFVFLGSKIVERRM